MTEQTATPNEPIRMTMTEARDYLRSKGVVVDDADAGDIHAANEAAKKEAAAAVVARYAARLLAAGADSSKRAAIKAEAREKASAELAIMGNPALFR